MASLSQVAVDQLKASLSQESVIVSPAASGYSESIKRWSTAAEKHAGLVIYPTTPRDISEAVLFSKTHQIDLATVCGGHATSGSSSTDGGLCINLSLMRKIDVDVDALTIKAQGGSLWSDVYREAGLHDLSVVGGVIDHTGVGGLTLGGGYGLLTGERGLVIDNLLNVEIVLANGSIVIASEEENIDLFWAVRGAGASFGIVTSFTYRAFRQPSPVWAGAVFLPLSELAGMVEFSNDFMHNPDDKGVMFYGFGPDPTTQKLGIVVMVFYNGSESEARLIYEPLFNLKITSNATREMPFSEANTLMNAGMAHGLRRSLKGSAFMTPVDVGFAEYLLKELQHLLQKIPDAGYSLVLFECCPYNKIIEVSQTATAFANRGAYGNILFCMGWTKEEHDTECREWTRNMSAKTHADLERRKAIGTHHTTQEGVGEYFNYDGIGVDGDIVFGVNFPKLVKLKKQYDPHNIFNKGPKLLL